MKIKLRLFLVGALLSLVPMGVADEEADDAEVARILTFNVLADPVHKVERLESLCSGLRDCSNQFPSGTELT